MTTKPVRIGIIGMGNMGTAHARSILDGNAPELTLTAVCDRNEYKLDPYKNLATYTNTSDLIHSGKIDAVLIATPHYDHTTSGIAALKAGLHTLIEKPISAHKADCEKLIAAHTNKQVVFAAMFNQRTDPRYRKLKQLIDNGELGALQRISWNITDWYRTDHYYASGGWRATWGGEGGGVLLNQCPHQLDLWQWLFGMPTRVRAFCQFGRFHPIEVEDAVTAVLEYESGATGTFVTTTGEAPGVNRLEVAGERGLVVITPSTFTFTRNEQPTSEHLKTSPRGFGKPDVWDVSFPITDRGEKHLGILKNFAAAILHDTPLIAPAAEGMHSVELANAMLLSSAQQETLTLPIDTTVYAAWLQERITQSTFTKTGAKKQIAIEDMSSTFGS